MTQDDIKADPIEVTAIGHTNAGAVGHYPTRVAIQEQVLVAELLGDAHRTATHRDLARGRNDTNMSTSGSRCDSRWKWHRASARLMCNHVYCIKL